MICPHCGIAFRFEPIESSVIVWDKNMYSESVSLPGHLIEGGYCSECKKIVVVLKQGLCKYYVDYDTQAWYMAQEDSSEIIYPQNKLKQSLSEEIPENYRADYREALQVLKLSPKSSAAISRRVLQQILHNEYGISKRDLSMEIEEFINRPGIPTYLSKSLDAIRNIGNFAAHPIKSTNSGEIVEVEPGEAEWTLEVLDSFFDFTFVQPIKLEERRNELNQKLRELGKPLLKG